MSDLFNDLTITTLAKSMDAAGTRHKVIANNIANVDTPGFIRSDVSFEDELKQVLSVNEPGSKADKVRDLKVQVQQDLTSPTRENGNNVSIDKEMTDLSKNTLQYETLGRLLSMKLGMLMTAITEGKR